ncbi:MAG: TetR/AcrR family transcriptional regulator [Clostridia bacterium]|nr:TetR/AcrR family transcriptional regulator [Clostridia bacterium]
MARRGETREILINAATKVFFQNGFEKTSVKMILEEAHIVTGSFYHFFPSKEALFEAVMERFLEEYAQRMDTIFRNDTLAAEQIVARVLGELRRTFETYYNILQGDKLHWTVQAALHDRTLDAMVQPLAQAISKRKTQGSIASFLAVDDVTLAKILIKGTEAVISGQTAEGARQFVSEKAQTDILEFWKRIIRF